MSTRPPLHVTSPRAAAHAAVSHGSFPPSTIPARPMSASTSLMSSRPTEASIAATSPRTSLRPKRPLSVSRVQMVSARPSARPGGMLGTTSSTRRPASASRVRATYTTATLTRRVDNESQDNDVDTIAIPMARIQVEQPVDEPTTPTTNDTTTDEAVRLDHTGDVAMDRTAMAEAEKFLRAWQYDEASFRSPLLFAEASFAQANAKTLGSWPHPNVFLSSIAFGSLELFCKSLEHHHPFLVELIDALSSAVFSNHRELRRARLQPNGHYDSTSTAARFLWYMQHGQYYFQQLQDHQEQLAISRRIVQLAKRETQELSQQLQKTHVARLFDRVQARVKAAATHAADNVSKASTSAEKPYPQLRHMLFGGQRGARLDLEDVDYEFEPTAEEILLIFKSLRPQEAMRLLRAIQTKACDIELPQLGEMYATAVDVLPEIERRKFLSEYFQLVDSAELQDALRTRDEVNADKRWETFLSEMKDALRLSDMSDGKKEPTAQFHSDEARIGASVYELVDLIEDIATDVSLADDKKTLKLSPELIARLKPYQSLKKRMEKAKQLMMTVPHDVPSLTAPTTCGCVCGKHRLVNIDEPDVSNTTISSAMFAVREDPSEDESLNKKVSQKRQSVSGKSGKRKSTIRTVSARVSTRNSMATVRLFPLSEVCLLVSSVVQLQFAREYGEGAMTRRGSVRRDRRKSCDPSLIQRPSFKVLAKDLLTRKYGIKSIAVLHMLQMEKSLVHYSANNKHIRCELFAWFVGADKTRSHYKDLAFQFYLRAVKCVIAVVLKKPMDALSYADLISGWTENIGDADSSAGVVSLKTLTSTQSIDACNALFPGWMKDSSAFTLLIERLRVVIDSVDVEQVFKRIMAAWETQLITAHAQIQEIFIREATANVEELDFLLFCKCVAASGLDMTSGQLLEAYDNLATDDEAGVSIHKGILFVIEQKQQ